MSACPTCGKPVDALRAPAVVVRDGKVLGFCSKECAAGQPAAAPARAAAQPATPAKGSKRTPAAGVPKSVADLDSGPVIEILHEPASGVVASSADARFSSRPSASMRAEADGAIQIADTGHIDDYVGLDEPGRGRGKLVVLVLLLLVAGGACAAYYLGYLDHLLGRNGAEAATRVPVVAPPVPVATPDAAPTITPGAALERARTVLHSLLGSPSPRVQRLAATALARTGDAAAIQLLAAEIDKESSDITKLDIAYALARAGDHRGTDALVAALTSPRRDVKGEAARRLALLGDKRAIPVLEQFLEYSQFRLGAAEQLAYLADPHALAVLDTVRGDPKATPDDQARAAIALGLAGRGDMTDALHALLSDARFNAFAATALASLHDAAARPILVKQLAIPSLRVEAARALRRLDPKLEPTPLLPALVAALDRGKDTEEVQAAEAILLLAGDLTWSEHE